MYSCLAPILLMVAAPVFAAELPKTTAQTRTPQATEARPHAGPLSESAARAPDWPLSPEQALSAFRLEPGLRIELVAAEPTVGDPVAMAFDERGRIYVAENRGYPTGPGEGKPPAGVIAVLEDSDGDGHYEKRTVFAEGLTYPNGVLPWKGGLFVTCAPDLLYLKDTNGDGRADIQRVVFTGFATNGSTQLRVCYPTLGIDNWIYLASGLSGGAIRSPDYPNHPPVEIARTDFRFRPDAGEFEAVDGKAQFGLAFDEFGHRFICMNRVHIRHVVVPSRYLRRNPHLPFSDTVQDCPEEMVSEPLKGHGAAARIFPISRNVTTADSHAGTFTAACGLLIYQGTALPDEYRGNVLACDPTGNLVHRDRLVPRGATFAASRVREGVELVASTDDWFRPVFLANGPDGALYLCDMYRKTIEHPQYLPEEIRKRTDFESGKGMGRIYRVVGDASAGRARRRQTLLDTAPQQLCEHLNDADGWVRDTAHRLLVERKDAAAIPKLKALAGRAATPQTRLHALRILEALDGLDDAAIRRALADEAAGVRDQAIQLAERLAGNAASWLAPLVSRAADVDARVRFQCALTLGELDDRRIIPALAQVAGRDAADRWTRAAVLSSISRRPEELLRLLIREAARRAARDATQPPPVNGDALPALMNELARTLALGAATDRLPSLTQQILASDREIDSGWQMAALAGMVEGLRARRLAQTGQSLLAGALADAANGTEATRHRIGKLLESARGVVADARQPMPVRLAAVGLLGQEDFGVTGQVLLALLDPHQPAALHSAAIRSLAQMKSAGIVPALLARERWLSYSPAVREAIFAALLAQPFHVPPVLAALEAGEIPAGAIDPARRKQLREHRDEQIRQRAVRLFEGLETGDRMKVYQDLKSALKLAANALNGRAIFKQHCAACHRLDREGVAVGPDLFGIRTQPKEVILLHLLIPEFEILPGYTSYSVETRDGRTLSGLIASETDASITLRRALGEEETVLRSNIASISATGLSLMPQELEKNMSRQDLADLIAYLKGE